MQAAHYLMFRRYSSALRFFVLFAIILLALIQLQLTPLVNGVIVVPWTEAMVRISAGIMALFDSHVATSGNNLRNTTNGFSVAVESGCNGLEAAMVLIAAMLVFPSPWKHRVIGVLVGLFAVEALNIVRIISLFYLGQWNMDIFHVAHLYLWQMLIMLDALVVWLVWIRVLPPQTTAAPLVVTQSATMA